MPTTDRVQVGVRAAALIAAFLLLCLHDVRATSYAIAPAYQITCLDLETGKKLWEKSPGVLPEPTLQIVNGKLLVQGELPGPLPKNAGLLDRPPMRPVRYLLDPVTGRTLRWSAALLKAPVQAKQLEPPEHLTDSEGRKFEYDEGNTHDLVVVKAGAKTETVLALEDYVHGLNLFGSLALFTFAGGSCCGGEVYAYDLKRKRLAWEFDASKVLPQLSERSHTSLAVVGQRLYVSVDQVVFALDPATGKQLWMTRLPQQALRSFDDAWATFAPVNSRLLVQVYEDLFMLDPSDGRLIWSFNAGEFGKPWPLVYGNRVYLASMPSEEGGSYDPNGKPGKQDSAIRITRKESGFSIEPLSRRDIPASEEIWWSLRPPPPGPLAQRGRRIVLELHDKQAVKLAQQQGQDGPLTLDLSEPLSRRASTYVKFTQHYNKAVLIVDGQVVLSKEW